MITIDTITYTLKTGYENNNIKLLLFMRNIALRFINTIGLKYDRIIVKSQYDRILVTYKTKQIFEISLYDTDYSLDNIETNIFKIYCDINIHQLRLLEQILLHQEQCFK
jgi:hypothetical protein